MTVTRRTVQPDEARRANRRWWDKTAAWYQAEHAVDLGEAKFLWCPEGLDEEQARLLGDVRGRRVLEVGCGGGQCGRWLVTQGATVVGCDLSYAQLTHSSTLGERTGVRLPAVQADACALPFADASFDVACSAFGAIPFVAEPRSVMSEVARVLRPGGRWVFSTTHPVRWCFADDPGEGGLVVRDSYFDRRAYVEASRGGRTTYVETHRTLGDRVRDIVAAGLVLIDLVEPEWPEDRTQAWDAWSPLRGQLIPGTAIFVCQKPG